MCVLLKECCGAVLNRLKRISGLGPPISPSGHQGAPISSSLGSLICPLRHQRAPQINVPLASSGAQFPVFLIRSFSCPQFPHCFIKGLQCPHCVIKGQRAINFPSRHQGPPISSSCHQNDDLYFPSRYQGVPIHHCVIKGPIVTSNFPSRYQGVPFIIASSRGPHFHYRVIKGTQISKTYHEMCTDGPYLKLYRDKRVQSLSWGVCRRGVKGIRF